MDKLNPNEVADLELLTEEYRSRFGVGVGLIKEQVGPGDEYTNAVVRAVVSANGAWCECVDQPMEFSGFSGGPVEYHFISDAAALDLFAALHDLAGQVSTENTRRFMLLALYSSRGIADPREAYIVHCDQRTDGSCARVNEIGSFRPGALPLFYRCRLDTDLDAPPTMPSPGGAFCLTGMGERNLLVSVPHSGGDIRDLAELQPGRIAH